MMRWVVLILAALVAGCAVPTPESLTSAEERAAAARVITLLRNRDVAGLRTLAGPGQGALSPELVGRIAAITPPTGEVRLVTAASESITSRGRTTSHKAFNFDVGEGRRWALVQVVLDTSRPQPVLTGLQVFPGDARPSTANDFGRVKRGAVHYLWIAAMVLAAATCMVGAAIALRSARFRRHRWAWLLGCLVGVCTFALDWTRGTVSIEPVSVLLLAAAAFRAGPFAPWVLSVAVPVVPIVVLLLEKRWQGRVVARDR